MVLISRGLLWTGPGGPGQRGGVHGGEGPRAEPTSIAEAPWRPLRTCAADLDSPWAPRLSCFGFWEVSQGRGPPKKPEQVLAPWKADVRMLLPPLGAQVQMLLSTGSREADPEQHPRGAVGSKRLRCGPGAAPGSPSPKLAPELLAWVWPSRFHL